MADNPTHMASKPARFLRRLLAAIGRPADAQPAAPPPFQVVLCAPVAAYAETVAAALEGMPGLRLRVVPVGQDDSGQQGLTTATLIRVRQAMVDGEADVAIWCEGFANRLTLRWITPMQPDDERPGCFGMHVRMELTGSFESVFVELAHAATLAAIQPESEERRRNHATLLAAAAERAAIIAEVPPFLPHSRQQATTLFCVGHVAAATAAVDEPLPWLERSVAAYRRGLERLRPDDLPPMEEAIVYRRLAAALTALAERSGDDVSRLREAAAAWRNAAETLPRASLPFEWATDQVRLGSALYRLDLKTGDPALLREALAALQAALQVFTRSENPIRWTETMLALAQVLEVYGDQSRNPDILQKAVDACRAVLEVRTAESDPAGRAATLNTLGSALFLLGKHGEGVHHLDEAAAVLRAARDELRAMGAEKPAAVAERNLAHVDRLLRQRGGGGTSPRPPEPSGGEGATDEGA